MSRDRWSGALRSVARRASRCAWVVLLGALACTSEPGPDAGLGDAGEDVGVRDADLPDAAPDAGRDAGARDARVDAGPRDAGACGCSYGFHQECPNGQICQTGRFESARGMCVRADPRGGSLNGRCDRLFDDPLAGSCTAQCEPYQRGTPCGDLGPTALAGWLDSWALAVQNASTNYPDLQTPQHMSATDLARVRGETFDECGELLGWTVLGLIELCRGDDALIPPPSGSFNVMEAWYFKPVAMDDDCRLRAGGLCLGALREAANGESIDYVNAFIGEIPSHCPNGLPYGSACSGPDAQACVIARVRTIYQALRTRR